jgi:hypothetical protein
MDDERVAAFERELWHGGAEVYRQRIADDCLMVVPAEPFVLAGDEAVRAVEDTPRWREVELSDLRISRPQEGLIVIAYKVEASRAEDGSAGERYVAYCTSTLRRRGHEDWEVVQHQQTVPPAL